MLILSSSNALLRLGQYLMVCMLVSVCVPVLGANIPQKACRSIEERKEWRDMMPHERKAWTRAVLCLHGKPARNGFGGATTRFEQFSAVHAQLYETTHYVGQFLPWHRLFITIFHNALREECSYDGAVPYWDWTRDAAAPDPISASPVFDPVTGLGGDGVPGTYTIPSTEGLHSPWTARGCVGTGPFKDMVLRVGPGTTQHGNPHCLTRGFNEARRPFLERSAVEEALDAPTFTEFCAILDRDKLGIHGGAHAYVSGELGDGASPNDPLFYLHHGQMDRIWWLWQRNNPSVRLLDFSGPDEQEGTEMVTLDYVLEYPGLGRNYTAREVMDSYAKPLCYTY